MNFLIKFGEYCKEIKMLKKLFLIFISLMLFSISSFAQEEGDNVEIVLGGIAKCSFSGRVPFRKIQAINNTLITDMITGRTEISFQIELDSQRKNLNAEIVTLIESLPPGVELLGGAPIDFDSINTRFSIVKASKIDGTIFQVSNETPQGNKTVATGTVVISRFEGTDNLADGVVKLVFDNTFRTIQKPGEDVEIIDNGKVKVKCSFKNIPVSISSPAEDLLQ